MYITIRTQLDKETLTRHTIQQQQQQRRRREKQQQQQQQQRQNHLK